MRNYEYDYQSIAAANELLKAMPMHELDEPHRKLVDRNVVHGDRDAALYHLALNRRPGVIPYGVTIGGLKIGAKAHDWAKPLVTGGDSTLWDRKDLSAEDYEKIHKHPAASYNFLVYASAERRIHVPDAALDIVLHHHEWVNGMGYPHRLYGPQIPTHVQLFSVVDYVISLAEGPEDRPYRDRAATPHEITILLAQAGQEGRLNADFTADVLNLLRSGIPEQVPELSLLHGWGDGGQ